MSSIPGDSDLPQSSQLEREEPTRTILSPRDGETLTAVINDADARPNANLAAAAKRYLALTSAKNDKSINH